MAETHCEILPSILCEKELCLCGALLDLATLCPYIRTIGRGQPAMQGSHVHALLRGERTTAVILSEPGCLAHQSAASSTTDVAAATTAASS
jgi:hypothetical protein